jgi:hypothetical protein
VDPLIECEMRTEADGPATTLNLSFASGQGAKFLKRLLFRMNVNLLQGVILDDERWLVADRYMLREKYRC